MRAQEAAQSPEWRRIKNGSISRAGGKTLVAVSGGGTKRKSNRNSISNNNKIPSGHFRVTSTYFDTVEDPNFNNQQVDYDNELVAYDQLVSYFEDELQLDGEPEREGPTKITVAWNRDHNDVNSDKDEGNATIEGNEEDITNLLEDLVQ